MRLSICDNPAGTQNFVWAFDGLKHVLRLDRSRRHIVDGAFLYRPSRHHNMPILDVFLLDHIHDGLKQESVPVHQHPIDLLNLRAAEYSRLGSVCDRYREKYQVDLFHVKPQGAATTGSSIKLACPGA